MYFILLWICHHKRLKCHDAWKMRSQRYMLKMLLDQIEIYVYNDQNHEFSLYRLN